MYYHTLSLRNCPEFLKMIDLRPNELHKNE